MFFWPIFRGTYCSTTTHLRLSSTSTDVRHEMNAQNHFSLNLRSMFSCTNSEKAKADDVGRQRFTQNGALSSSELQSSAPTKNDPQTLNFFPTRVLFSQKIHITALYSSMLEKEERFMKGYFRKKFHFSVRNEMNLCKQMPNIAGYQIAQVRSFSFLANVRFPILCVRDVCWQLNLFCRW